MGIIDLQKGIDLINKSGEGDFEGPKSADLINLAKNKLGLEFSKSYEEFLLNLGCGDMGGIEFYGIIDSNFNNSAVPNGIWLTLAERVDSDLAKEYIIVAQGIEGYYVLDTSKMDNNKECPVVEWIPNTPKDELEVIAPSYGTFFMNSILEVV